MKPLRKASSKTDETFDYLQRVIIIGDSGVGQSNLLLRYSEGKFVDNYMMTIGINYVFKVISLISFSFFSCNSIMFLNSY